MIEFLPDAIVFSPKIALVRLNNVDHHLWVLFLFVFGDATIGQNPLPIGRESLDRMNQIRIDRMDQTGGGMRTYRKLAGLIVVADMDHVHGILGSGDLDCPGGAEHVVDEARKPALLSKWTGRL